MKRMNQGKRICYVKCFYWAKKTFKLQVKQSTKKEKEKGRNPIWREGRGGKHMRTVRKAFKEQNDNVFIVKGGCGVSRPVREKKIKLKREGPIGTGLVVKFT